MVLFDHGKLLKKSYYSKYMGEKKRYAKERQVTFSKKDCSIHKSAV
jgi:hypothetical protein